MIRAGEHSGALEIVLVRLADFTESQARLRSKIMGTMAYPIAMMVIGSVVLGILFTVVIPRVTKIFEDTKATLPWMTRGAHRLHLVRDAAGGGCSSSSPRRRSGASCAGARRRPGARAGTASC